MSEQEAITESKSDRTRARILEAALKLFRAQGFDATTMREIANAAGLSPGAAYYYFESKEAMILAYYREGEDQALRDAQRICSETTSFRDRLERVTRARMQQLAPDRELVRVLARNSLDLLGSVSAFGEDAAPMRAHALAVLRRVIDGSDLRASTTLAPRLPLLLWVFQLGVLLFWANDRSDGQRRTEFVLARGLDLATLLLRASVYPWMGRFNRALVDLCDAVDPGPQARTTPT